MSKICQCHEMKIKRFMEELGIGRESVGGCFNGVDEALQSDCVCEKKDDGNGPKDFMVIHVDEGLSDEHTEVICMKCKHQATVQLEEKQNQSPCEHDLEEVGDLSLLSDPPLYPCKCRKCGHKGNYTQEELSKFRLKKTCEHEWSGIRLKSQSEEVDFDNLPICPLIPVWMCNKCGLVTCLDPNDK